MVVDIERARRRMCVHILVVQEWDVVGAARGRHNGTQYVIGNWIVVIRWVETFCKTDMARHTPRRISAGDWVCSLVNYTRIGGATAPGKIRLEHVLQLNMAC